MSVFSGAALRVTLAGAPAQPKAKAPDAHDAAASMLDASAFGGSEDGDLSKMTNPELAQLASTLGVTVPRKATKAQLVELIEQARG